MQTIKQLCTPRTSVFDTQRRDTVLDISDLIGDKIDPNEFFEENWITEGMSTLLEQSFKRLEGKSNQGVFKLKQAMGGGKTHNLLTLGLLAKHPEFRQKVMGSFYSPDSRLGPVKVVAFSGRESDAPLGIWGSIAAQLGKKELFNSLYMPLQAPGQTAWENLLSGQTVLILLDELAPYIENAKSKAIGNSDLAHVTATALSNLLVAVGRGSCARVCLVITELVAAYEGGSQQILSILSDFENETHRTAMSIEPVRMNSDELYHILRKRIFEGLPPQNEINEVAQAYGKAIRDARQMGITSESPEKIIERTLVSYPFHPAIRDLYARFKENPGFQQTRGLIRLMRIVTSRLWNTGLADSRYLIAAHDLDFNDRETRTEVSLINNTLENAIAHDIAAEGAAVAEKMDESLSGHDTQDACRLLLMASLANVPNAVLGLSIPEVVADLAEPNRDLARLRSDVLEKLSTAAWYLHSDRDGKLFFRNVENLAAKLEGLVRTYQKEQAVKELRTSLEELFKPINGWCYQKVLCLPAIDEIDLEQEKITLVITEPYEGGGLRGELNTFYDQVTWKNRVAFLTGSKNTYDQLVETGKRLKAIKYIIDGLHAEHGPENDPQMKQATELNDRIQGNFHSAVRETFSTLWYPIDENNLPVLRSADFSMRFEGNRYNGEQQILDLLKEKMKFEEDITTDTFRKKCEARLFTTQSMLWSEIKRRAAINTKWQWHLPRALDDLKTSCIQKDVWREEGGYVDKGPFPQPVTSVLVNETSRDDDTGEVNLRVMPVHADTVYYDIGAEATTASAKLEGSSLKSKELKISFLAVDSTGQHKTGEVVNWKNRITLKHRISQSGMAFKMELQAAPNATIHYTTDGSDPKLAGAVYDCAFIVPANTLFVLAYAERDGISSQVESFPIPTGTKKPTPIDPTRPLTWLRKQAFNSTKETYEFLQRATKYQSQIISATLTISGEGADREWIELNMYEEKHVDPALIEECLACLRKLQTTGQVSLISLALHFKLGQDFLDWVDEAHLTFQSTEIKQ
jgi:hypothetical protein